jgi:hypothetical protein
MLDTAAMLPQEERKDVGSDFKGECPNKYPKTYHPKPLIEQKYLLRAVFPSLGCINDDLIGDIDGGNFKLPDGAEGWFAIFNRVKHPEIFGSYSHAVKMLFNRIEENREGLFVDHCRSLIDEEHLRQSARTIEALEQISRDQGNWDVLFIPAQFGMRYREQSALDMRKPGGMASNEFCLGAFDISTMLISHPERLKDTDDLRLSLVGDELDGPESKGDFDRVLGIVPGYEFPVRSRISVLPRSVGQSDSGFGIPTAFIPGL